MAEVYVTLGEAAELERVKYNTMVKRVLRKQESFVTKTEKSENGGKDVVLVAVSSLSKQARNAWKEREKLKSFTEEFPDKKEDEQKPEVPWYVNTDVDWYIENYKERYYKAVELGNVVRKFLQYDEGDRTKYAEEFAQKYLGKGQRTLYRYKAELQARGLAIMEDHNVKYVKFYGDEGSAAITDSMSLDILNPDKLKELVGEGVYKMKVKEETKTTYKFDSKFEKAMKAIFTGDYTFETTLEEFLDEMSIKPDDKQKKLLLKKLKGEFEKDKETLISVLVPEGETVPDFDVELWYIYRIKNGELIKAFLPEEMIDAIIEGIRKSIFVETKTSITLDYDDTEKED